MIALSGAVCESKKTASSSIHVQPAKNGANQLCLTLTHYTARLPVLFLPIILPNALSSCREWKFFEGKGRAARINAPSRRLRPRTARVPKVRTPLGNTPLKCAPHKIHKVLQQLQPDVLAFLGVKLRGKDIVAPDG